MNKLKGLVLALCLWSMAVSPAFAEELMIPEMDHEMMDRVNKYATPDANHKVLEALAGKWETTMKFWMASQVEPITSSGIMESKMIFDGRFLKQKLAGSFMGRTYEGLGIMGYDNIKRLYQYFWIDNMGTGMLKSDVQYDPVTRTFTEEGEVSCPETGGQRWYRSKVTVIDDHHYTQEIFMKDTHGKEFRSMEISYTRIQ